MEIVQKIQSNIPLAEFTTYKIGGPAKFFVEVETKEELQETFKWAEGNGEKVVIFGGGSNILVSDQGVNALVIHLNNKSARVLGSRIECGAGANLSNLAHLAVGNSLSGLEWTFGIPRATIGGAVRGNAGAFGAEIADVVETVEAYNIKKKQLEMFSKKFCEFNYRSSVFKTSKKYLIWNIVLKLQSRDKKEIDDKVAHVLDRRGKGCPRLPSAGSVFKNLKFSDIEKDNKNLADRIRQSVEIKDGKVGAGLLVDWADLKGKKIGGAKVSLEHGNFIVNTGRATADDVAILISVIKEKIRRQFNILLKEEIEYLGFD